MHHPVEGLPGKEPRDPLAVGQIQFLEAETRVVEELVQAGLFEGDIVVVVQVVEPDHAIPPREQSRGRVKTDEPGGTGQKDGGLCHARNPIATGIRP